MKEKTRLMLQGTINDINIEIIQNQNLLADLEVSLKDIQLRCLNITNKISELKKKRLDLAFDVNIAIAEAKKLK